MIALLQRVTEAAVRVDGRIVGEIGPGVLAFIGVEQGDAAGQAERLAARVLGYRIFPDAEGRMNRSLEDVGGGLLAVPQFTLAADTAKGARPSFSGAAPADEGKALFDLFVKAAGSKLQVRTGSFGAHMQVSLVNDGPVTFWLRVPPGAAA